MTTDELEAIKARADAATPGPWESGLMTMWENQERKLPPGWLAIYQIPTVVNTPWLEPDGEKRGWINKLISPKARTGDAVFIAHAREDIPALLLEVARLRTALDRIEDYCDNGGSDPRTIARWAYRVLNGVPYWEKAPTEG